jgi:hypothetical protein
MFGISLAKIVLTVAVIYIVWFVFKRRSSSPKPARNDAAMGSKDGASKIEDMVCCTACGSYVPKKGPDSCQREDCPFI